MQGGEVHFERPALVFCSSTGQKSSQSRVFKLLQTRPWEGTFSHLTPTITGSIQKVVFNGRTIGFLYQTLFPRFSKYWIGNTPSQALSPPPPIFESRVLLKSVDYYRRFITWFFTYSAWAGGSLCFAHVHGVCNTNSLTQLLWAPCSLMHCNIYDVISTLLLTSQVALQDLLAIICQNKAAFKNTFIADSFIQCASCGTCFPS